MLDRERILSKLDELDSYLKELDKVKPKDFNEYTGSIEKKRSCERLLQISIECVIDICSLLVVGLKLGLPSEEEDIINKVGENRILSEDVIKKLKGMRGFRNILVHRYGTIDDKLVYEMLENNINDFREFEREIKKYLAEDRNK